MQKSSKLRKSLDELAAHFTVTRTEIIAELDLAPADLFTAFLAALKKAPVKTLGEKYLTYESVGEQAKTLYDHKDAVLKKLVLQWKKNKRAPVDEQNYLDIEDAFRGQIKAFAPGFAHRYKLKLRKLLETD